MVLRPPAEPGAFIKPAMHDQADQLRKLVREAVDRHGALAPGAPLVVLSGGHAGAGVTTLVGQLARELARLGKQVVAVDANFSGAGLAETLAAKPHSTLREVLAGTRRGVEALASAGDGIRVLAGCEHPGGSQLNPEALDRFTTELAALCRQSDVVLVDAGAGMNPWIDRLWQLAQQVLLASTPGSAAALDAYAAVKLAHAERLDGKLRLVVNRCDDAGAAARQHAAFDSCCQRFLGCEVQAPVVLPTIAGAGDDQFARAVRLLAADLACDFRPVADRLQDFSRFSFNTPSVPCR
jgi:flagellar biosynthesis protein FlhG